jgi:putative FmdB family regulatory protein
MPTYEYLCTACGHEFEEVQKISDPAVERCPKCKKKKAQRLISQGNFILKGGGWYVTDYKGGAAKKPAPKDPDAAAGDKKPDTSDKKADASDSKPEPKTDTKASSGDPAGPKPDRKDDKPAKPKGA